MSRGDAHESGFTLVEVLVAMALMSVVMMLSWNALDLVLNARQRAENTVPMLDIATLQIKQDLLHLRPRPVRDGLGDEEAAYVAPGGQYLVRFTRGGRPVLAPGDSGLERVAYAVDRDGWLCRYSWSVLDRAFEERPTAQRMLSGVSEVEFSQLGGNGDWSVSWPPINTPPGTTAMPRGIRVSLRFRDGTEQVILMPGLEAAGSGRT